MSITSIGRYFVGDPNIVSIVTTDDLTAITTTGYITSQKDNIDQIQNGEFEFTPTDLILIYYSPAMIGFFVHDVDNDTFDELSPAGGLADTLQNGNIFVGNVSNIATGVTPSGDITLTNTGVFGIEPGVIVNSDINASAAIAFSKLAALPSAEILVGSGSNVPTAVAVTGDIALNNAGVSSIGAGVIINSDINAAAAISFSKLAALSSGNILVGSAGTVPTSVALSGDATISNTGALTIANNAVTSAKTALNLLQYFAMPISAAQFKGMYAAPMLLISAPGVNQLLVLEQIELIMTYGTTPYAGGGVTLAQYDNTVHGAGTPASTVFLDSGDFQAAASSIFTFAPNTDFVKPLVNSVNKGLYLSNTAAAYTTGDSTFVAHIWYRQVPVV